MKNLMYLIALAISFVITSCSDDSCTHNGSGPTPIDNWIEGLWYCEGDNEEINYGSTGTFYDRYSNVELSGELEGRYEMDYANMKLTYRYSDLGNNYTKDWTVKNPTEFSFELSSDIAPSLKVEKIVEQYKLNVGETVKLCFDADRADINVDSYTSKNDIIASVTPDGSVTAMGGKGTTYIKIATNVGNVWAKITIGDDNKDLWCDYVSLIGADYKTMRQYFSRIGEPASDGIDYFSYIMPVHQYIKQVNILVDTEEDFITAIQLYINEGIPSIEIESYIKSRYYEQEKFDFYTTQPDVEESKAIIKYYQDERCVTIFETQRTIHPELWRDFTKLFGLDKADVKSTMEKYGYSFLMSSDYYSVDGSDYYSITDNSYVNMVGFVFNPDKQVSEFWVYMDSNSNLNEVYNYLCAKYTEQESEATDYSLVFYNEDKSLKITFDLKNAAVVYTKLTMKQHKANTEILGKYYEGLGLTHAQIVDKFGTPYMDEDNMIAYVVGSAYVNLAVFNIKAETNKCYLAILTINESVASSTIVDYLNSKYTVYANGTASDGSQYAWTDGPSVAESTLGVIYRPEDKKVIYQPLGLSSKAKALTTAVGSFTMDFNLMKQADSQTSAFLHSIYKQKKSMMTHKSKQLETIVANYNK